MYNTQIHKYLAIMGIGKMQSGDKPDGVGKMQHQKFGIGKMQNYDGKEKKKQGAAAAAAAAEMEEEK
jgi:hypothetical protein